ncbi:hypothetical protein LUZ60_011286 [Juncus effusus]|nr:hypothetical protein LUZ60_011286 [Juncus effusus]
MRRVEIPISEFSPPFPSSFLNNRDVFASMEAPSIFFLLLAILLLLLLFLLFICRPWRFLLARRSSSSAETNEITRPLVLENSDDQSNGVTRNTADDQSQLPEESENSSPIRTRVFVNRKRAHSVESSTLLQEESPLIDSSNDSHEVGSTLKRTSVANWGPKDTKHLKRVSRDSSEFSFPSKDAGISRSVSITLEVISGPSSGAKVSKKGKENSSLTIGRVPPSDLVLKDSEVSGKHATVKWNPDYLRWELTDLGSLNGTFLNTEPVHHPDSGSRTHGPPVPLSDGDVITLGTTSNVSVGIWEFLEEKAPAGIGMASDPMAARRGAKPLPMEDVGLCQYPLPGFKQFGVTAVFDGHGGVGAAKSASKALPETVSKILSQEEKREKLLSTSDASDVLREAFALTEAQMDDHQYEGCTATVLLIWSDTNGDFFAQCANLGDSSCVMHVDGVQIVMSEDHKIISSVERARMAKLGKPLKEGEKRLCGINLSRMFGDVFLKEQDLRFSSEPYISQPVHVPNVSTAFAILASDGLWDVLSTKQAVQFVLENKEKNKGQDENSAERIAKSIVSHAKALRTTDNTTVVFVDFDSLRTDSHIPN